LRCDDRKSGGVTARRNFNAGATSHDRNRTNDKRHNVYNRRDARQPLTALTAWGWADNVGFDTTRLRWEPNIDPASYRSRCGDHRRKSNTAFPRGTADAQTTDALQAERSRIAPGPLQWQRSR
jgi:hypothetical protein